MPSVRDILATLESFAPSRWAFEFDNVGLLVGSVDTPITGIVTALDPSPRLAEYARSIGANLLLTHHPIFWNGTKSLTQQGYDSRFALEVARYGMAHIAAHTNWDSAPGGINDTLVDLLGLQNATSFGSAAMVPYSKIVVFCQPEQADLLIDVMADAGAGHIGHYRRCAYKQMGIGTFEPLPGSNPSVGRIGKSDEIEESKIEMICPTGNVEAVIASMIQKHNYEQPAFDVIPLAPLAEQPAGRIGSLPTPMTLSQFQSTVDANLNTRSMSWGAEDRLIQVVAVVGGAADGEWRGALAAGADVFITGEVKHHLSIEAQDAGLAVVAAGHYATENPGMRKLKFNLEKILPGLRIDHFEPVSGHSGRPIS